MQFASLPEEEFDKPFGASTGSGDIFAASGGVMESALRSAYYLLTGKDLTNLEFADVRGMAGVKEASITIGDRVIKVAVANRLSNARQIAERVKAGGAPWDFIEIMACPGGCAGGGVLQEPGDPGRLQELLRCAGLAQGARAVAHGLRRARGAQVKAQMTRTDELLQTRRSVYDGDSSGRKMPQARGGKCRKLAAGNRV